MGLPVFIKLDDGFVVQELDTIEPMRTWMVKWSTGDNIPTDPTLRYPHGCAVEPLGKHLKQGLWLISTDGYIYRSELLKAWGLSLYATNAFTTQWDQIVAYTHQHAEYLLLIKIREAEEARQKAKRRT